MRTRHMTTAAGKGKISCGRTLGSVPTLGFKTSFQYSADRYKQISPKAQSPLGAINWNQTWNNVEISTWIKEQPTCQLLYFQQLNNLWLLRKKSMTTHIVVRIAVTSATKWCCTGTLARQRNKCELSTRYCPRFRLKRLKIKHAASRNSKYRGWNICT